MKTFLTTLIFTLALTACTTETPEPQVHVNPQTSTEVDMEASSEASSESQEGLYVNNKFKFSLEVPEGLDYYVNEMFPDSKSDEDFSAFMVSGDQFSKFGVTGDARDHRRFEILPRKNNLGMSAVQFAKRSLEANRKYSKDIYSEEKESIFAGEKSFEFIGSDAFEERGLSHSQDGSVKDDPNYIEKAGQGRTLDVPHKIIYFDHDGVMYRIMIPLDNEVAQKILDSFKFLD